MGTPASKERSKTLDQELFSRIFLGPILRLRYKRSYRTLAHFALHGQIAMRYIYPTWFGFSLSYTSTSAAIDDVLVVFSCSLVNIASC